MHLFILAFGPVLSPSPFFFPHVNHFVVYLNLHISFVNSYSSFTFVSIFGPFFWSIYCCFLKVLFALQFIFSSINSLNYSSLHVFKFFQYPILFLNVFLAIGFCLLSCTQGISSFCLCMSLFKSTFSCLLWFACLFLLLRFLLFILLFPPLLRLFVFVHIIFRLAFELYNCMLYLSFTPLWNSNFHSL